MAGTRWPPSQYAPFEPAQGAVGPFRAGAVVRAEKDEGMLFQAEAPHGVENTAHTLVHGLDHFFVGHGTVGAAAFLIPLGIRQAVRFVFPALVGVVRGFVGEIETEGPVLVGFDETYAVFGDQVSAVAFLGGLFGPAPPIGVAFLVAVGMVVDVAAHITDEFVESLV